MLGMVLCSTRRIKTYKVLWTGGLEKVSKRDDLQVKHCDCLGPLPCKEVTSLPNYLVQLSSWSFEHDSKTRFSFNTRELSGCRSL